MTAQTRVSAKGQVVIPKDVRDLLAWPAGTPLDVVMTADGVTLRRAKEAKDQDLKAALARLQSIVKYDGPAGTEEGWHAALERMFAERAKDR